MGPFGFRELQPGASPSAPQLEEIQPLGFQEPQPGTIWNNFFTAMHVASLAMMVMRLEDFSVIAPNCTRKILSLLLPELRKELIWLAVEYEDRAIVVKVDTDEEYEFMNLQEICSWSTELNWEIF